MPKLLDRKKLVSLALWITPELREKIEIEARARGVRPSDLGREILADWEKSNQKASAA